jgi:hypothetical protein
MNTATNNSTNSKTETIMVTDFYEIDCDDLTFPNLTTINNMPLEILEVIQDHKNKMEIDQAYDEHLVEEKDNKVRNVQLYINTLINNINSLTTKKIATERYGRITELIMKFTEIFDEEVGIAKGFEAYWHYLPKNAKSYYKNIKALRLDILHYMKEYCSNYDNIENICYSLRNWFLLSPALEDNEEMELQFKSNGFWNDNYNNYNYNDYVLYAQYHRDIEEIMRDPEKKDFWQKIFKMYRRIESNEMTPMTTKKKIDIIKYAEDISSSKYSKDDHQFYRRLRHRVKK